MVVSGLWQWPMMKTNSFKEWSATILINRFYQTWVVTHSWLVSCGRLNLARKSPAYMQLIKKWPGFSSGCKIQSSKGVSQRFQGMVDQPNCDQMFDELDLSCLWNICGSAIGFTLSWSISGYPIPMGGSSVLTSALECHDLRSQCQPSGSVPPQPDSSDWGLPRRKLP